MLPHRFPMLLLDRVIECDLGKRVVAIKNVSINEPFFQGHYPRTPIMPGVLILEAMAQAGGVVMSSGRESDEIPVLAGVDGARFRKPVLPGDQLLIEATVVRGGRRMGKVKCEARVEGETVAQAELLFTYITKLSGS